MANIVQLQQLIAKFGKIWHNMAILAKSIKCFAIITKKQNQEILCVIYGKIWLIYGKYGKYIAIIAKSYKIRINMAI